MKVFFFVEHAVTTDKTTTYNIIFKYIPFLTTTKNFTPLKGLLYIKLLKGKFILFFSIFVLVDKYFSFFFRYLHFKMNQA